MRNPGGLAALPPWCKPDRTADTVPAPPSARQLASLGSPRENAADARVRAVLGPTNTGKTHLAIERMCGHSSGMMGFPLRLLAREVYDRVRAIKGDKQVALITGEERIEGVHQAFATRTSVTDALASRSEPIAAPAWLTTIIDTGVRSNARPRYSSSGTCWLLMGLLPFPCSL